MAKQLDDTGSSETLGAMSAQESANDLVQTMILGQIQKELAKNASSIPLNMDAALYRTAGDRNFGEVKTDEIRVMMADGEYIAQGFTEGILYVLDGQWGDIRQMAWPAAPAVASSDTSSTASSDAGSTASSSASSPASSDASSSSTVLGTLSSSSGGSTLSS